MKKFITALLVNVISLWVIDYLMSSIYIATPNALFAIAFVLMILNVTLKPLMKLIFLPVTFLSFGLFSLIINAVVLATAFSFAPGSYRLIYHGISISVYRKCSLIDCEFRY